MLSYHAIGAGEPIVLLHGSSGEGRAWQRVASCLTQGRRLVMPDLPGHGRSDAIPERDSRRTAAMGACIQALLEAIGEPVRLCGHSYGGNIALHTALGIPHLVERLVLFEPVFFQALRLTGRTDALAPAERFFAGYAERVAMGQSDALAGMVDYWFGQGAFDRLPPTVQALMRRSAATNALDVRASLAEPLTGDQLARFDTPTVVAYGSRTAKIAQAIATSLTGLLPCARLEVIGGAGHNMLDTHSDAVAKLIGT
jgi:pimeloyl-ACP methyl ester carboxylesterase